MNIESMKSCRTKSTIRNVAWLALGPIIFSASCSQGWVSPVNRGYNQAVQSGRETVPYARDFNQFFPNSDNFISYYTGQVGPPIWNSKAGLYGRYVLSLQFKIKFDETRTKITAYDDPEFYLREIREISKAENGNTYIQYGLTHKRFGKEEWKKIIESKGDLSPLGVPIIKDSPIPGFDKHWTSA